MSIQQINNKLNDQSNSQSQLNYSMRLSNIFQKAQNVQKCNLEQTYNPESSIISIKELQECQINFNSKIKELDSIIFLSNRNSNFDHKFILFKNSLLKEVDSIFHSLFKNALEDQDMSESKDNIKAPQQNNKNQYLKSNVPKVDLHPQSNQICFLPEDVKFLKSFDDYLPAKIDKTIFDSFPLTVYVEREKTGFEDCKDFPIVVGSLIAGRYRVLEYLGSASFSKCVHAKDLKTNFHCCLKIIENNKDFIDQSIDEIKLLRYIKANDPLDEINILKYYDSFYYKEHLFISTEILKDNLLEYYKFNLENETEKFFTLSTLKKFSKQILKSLDFLHSLQIIHCDVKPDNIMVKSYSKPIFKLIDVGSSCFSHDHLSSYVQSRSYRAPEVLLESRYDSKIDIWSFGLVLCELFLGKPLIKNGSVIFILKQIQDLFGILPSWMLKNGKISTNYYTPGGLLFKNAVQSDEDDADFDSHLCLNGTLYDNESNIYGGIINFFRQKRR